MRCKRILAIVSLTVCLTACGNSTDNGQNDGADHWDADGNPMIFSDTAGQGYETTVAEESETDTVTETVRFHDKIIEKSKLSQETIEWLEMYNSLSAEGQMVINYIPHELLDYSEGEDVAVETNTVTESTVNEAVPEETMPDNFSVVSEPLLDVTPEIWGISLSADNIAPAGLTVVITQSDGEKPIGDYFTGSWYELQKKLGDEWTAVEYLPQEYDIAWTDEAYSIPENDSVSFDIDWEWLYGELPRGEYRITKEIMTGSGATLERRHYYAEFVIE